MPPPSDTNPSPSDAEGAPRLRRWGRRVLWGLGALIGTGLLLVGLLLLVLQTERGATATAQFLLPRVNPMANTTLSVEGASGNWVRSLRLTNVSLTRPDSASGRSVSMAHVDTIAVQYRLGALLQGRLHLTSVSVDAPSVQMRQTPDSTWDWARLLPESDAAPDDTSAALPIQIDRLRVGEGQFGAVFYAAGQDSTARVQELELQAHDLKLGPSYEGRLDTLGLRGRLPSDTTALRLATAGTLSSGRLQIDTLRLASPRSQVVAHGGARLPLGPHDTLDDVSLSLRAAPLVLGDLTAFAPTLAVDPREAIDLDVRLTGSGRRLSLATKARVHDGGTLEAEVEATPRTEAAADRDSLRYRMEAQAHRLTTSLLGPPDAAQNVVSAAVEGTLEGRTLATLSGSIRTEITNTRLYGLRTSEMTVQTIVKKGTADVNLQGALNEAPLSITGTARPFDPAPSADLTAKIRTLSLAAVAPETGFDGSITATAQLNAQSIATSDATYDVDVTLHPSQIEAQPIEGGRFFLAVRPEEVSIDGILRFPRGQLQAVGSAALDGSERFTLDRGRFDDVNVAALLGDPTESRVSGTIRAQGRGFASETMQGRATLTIPDAHYGPHQLSALNTEARLDAGRLSAEMSARLNGGEWTLSAVGRPFAAVPSAELTDGRFRNVDIGPFLQDTTQSSALHGTLRGRVQGTTAATLQLEAGLTLEPSRLNRQNISGASLNATMQNAVLQSSLTLDTPNGGAHLDAEARPFDETPSLRILNGSFSTLNVGALAEIPGLETDLSGALSLSAQGAALSRLSLDSELRVRESTLNRAALPNGRLSVTAKAGRIEASGEFSVAGGALQLKGHLDSLDQTPTYALRTTARSLDLGALAGINSLESTLRSAQWTVNGRGTALDSLTASTRFSADSLRVDQTRIHALTLTGTLDRGLFRVDTLSAHSNVGTVQGEGPLGLTANAPASKFALQATMTSAAPLRRLAGSPSLHVQNGTVNAHVYGTAGEQRFDGTLELNGFIYDDFRLSNVKGTFEGTRGTSQLLGRLEVEAQAGYLSALGLTATQTRVQSVYDGTTVELSSDVELDATHRASLTASFRPLADSIDLRLHQFNARLGPDRWSLREKTALTIGETYRVNQLQLESGPQRLEADGVVNPTGSQNLRIALEELRLGDIAPLMGLTGLDGRATGRLALTGPASGPSMDGRLNLALQSQQEEVGTLRLNVGYDDLAVALDARLAHRDGSVLTVTGSIPADLRLQSPTDETVSDRPVRLDASTEQFPINWIDPFLDPESVRSVTGTLTADAAIRGTLNEPDLSGTISVSNLGASLPSLKTRYRKGSARLQMTGNQVTVTESRIRSTNGGSLRMTGLINFPELTVGEYDLTINASNFLAINTPAYRQGAIDGQMSLRGTVQRPVLNGNVQIQSASVYYAEALAESAGTMSTVSLSPQDQLTLEERFGIRLTASDTTTFDMYQALAMDLTVGIESDTWLRSNGTPEMNIQFTGDLDVQKAPNQDPRIFGTIDVLGERSTLRQFGQEFQITEGLLTFNGDPYRPYLDLTAVYDQQARGTQGSEVIITLSLSGRPENLSPTLSSEPPMDTRNILSYLATGRPANSLFSGDSEGGNLATQVALGQATNFVENLAASELGLDVVRLQVRPEGASYLTVGRYLTPRFFASIEQPVLTSSSQTSTQTAAFIPDVTLEYQFTDYLLLRSRSNQQSLQLNFLFEYAY